MRRKLRGFRGVGPDAQSMPSLNFTITARLQGPLDAEQLEDALARLKLRHPLLAARLEHDQQGQLFMTDEGTPPVPLRIVEAERDDHWAREVEREVVQRSDYLTGPLFRVVWVRGRQSSDLILVCDHFTADGRAGIVALHDLLSLLGDPGLRLEPVEAPPLAEIVPPAMRELADQLCPPREDAPQGGGWHQPPLAPDPLRVLPIALGSARTAALLARCRAERTTVQGALCAAFLMAYAERHPDEPVRRVEIPVDIRGRLTSQVDRAYNSYISFAVVDVDCAAGQDAWEIARCARAGLEAQLTDEQLFTYPFILFMLTGRAPGNRPFRRDYDLSISNLGNVRIPARYGPLQLEHIYGPTMNVSIAGHRILGVTGFDGKLCCTFTSRDPSAPEVAERATQLLSEMIG